MSKDKTMSNLPEYPDWAKDWDWGCYGYGYGYGWGSGWGSGYGEEEG